MCCAQNCTWWRNWHLFTLLHWPGCGHKLACLCRMWMRPLDPSSTNSMLLLLLWFDNIFIKVYEQIQLEIQTHGGKIIIIIAIKIVIVIVIIIIRVIIAPLVTFLLNSPFSWRTTAFWSLCPWTRMMRTAWMLSWQTSTVACSMVRMPTSSCLGFVISSSHPEWCWEWGTILNDWIVFRLMSRRYYQLQYHR